MSKTLGAKIGFAITAFAMLVSIVAFLMLDKSFAWFARNESVNARGIALRANEGDLSTSLLSLGVLEIGQDGVYTFDTTTDVETGARIQCFELPVDDPNGISYSKYRKALLLELSISVMEDRPTRVSLTTPNKEPSLEQKNFFSNCITVSNVASYTENTVTKGSVQQPFVTVGSGGAQKTDELVLYEGTLQAGVVNKLYFIIEYNNAFLDYINNYIMNTDSVDYSEVFYYHDGTLEVS